MPMVATAVPFRLELPGLLVEQIHAVANAVKATGIVRTMRVPGGVYQFLILAPGVRPGLPSLMITPKRPPPEH